MSTDSEAARRARSIKRCFVLLRFCDRLRVPRPNIQRVLESSGRWKELEFLNNSTTLAIQDLVRHAFQQHLNPNEVSRLNFYRTVSGSSVLTLAGTWSDMCGDSLKQTYRNRSKVFMRVNQDISELDIEQSLQVQDNDVPAAGQSTSPARSFTGDDLEVISSRQDANSITTDDDLDRPAFASTPIVPSAAASQAKGDTFVKTLYDSVITSDKAVIRQGYALAAKATEVGTLEEELDHLVGAEANPRSGPAYDLQVLRRLMERNDVPQVLPFICNDSQEMRTQCHADCTPLVLIRYRPTKSAINTLSSLLATLELLKECNLHAALQGSDFDDKACGKHRKSPSSSSNEDLEIRIMHPTLSPTRMIVASIIAGSESDFMQEVIKAIEQAQEAAKALKAHRDLIEQDRASRMEQEEENLPSADDEVTVMDDTVVDTEEVCKRRLEELERRGIYKRPRINDGCGSRL